MEKSPSRLNHVFNQSEKLIKVSSLVSDTSQYARSPKPQHVTQTAWCDALVKLLVSDRLEGNIKRPRVIKLKDTNSLAAPKHGIAEHPPFGTDVPRPEMDLTV